MKIYVLKFRNKIVAFAKTRGLARKLLKRKRDSIIPRNSEYIIVTSDKPDFLSFCYKFDELHRAYFWHILPIKIIDNIKAVNEFRLNNLFPLEDV